MLIAALVALVCALAIAASVRRLLLVFSVPFTDPEVLLRALRELHESAGARDLDASQREDQRREVRTWIEVPPSSFEGAVLALDPLRAPGELALMLLEIEHELGRWARVPRVAASIASSVGFLGGAASLRRGLLEVDVPDFDAAILRGVGVVGMGLATAITCALLHRNARHEARRRLRAADALVATLTRDDLEL
jgi:hypothetical protein